METGPAICQEIPPREWALEHFDVDQFDIIRNGEIHCKTCSYTILAQAVTGRYEIFCGGHRHADLEEGEAFLTGAHIPLKIIHHGDRKQGYRMRARWIHMHFMLFGSMDVTSLLQMPLRVTRRQCEPFAEIMEEYLRDRKRPGLSLGDCLRRQALAFRALQLLCDLAPPQPEALSFIGHKDRLAPVLSFMKEHLSDDLTVLELARRANMSAPHFYSFFRRQMGRSPMRHLKYLRLARVCALLAASDAPLRVVAEETGFCNEFHLSREFSRQFGKPPGTWRRDYDPVSA